MSVEHQQARESLKFPITQTEQPLKEAIHKNDLNVPHPDIQYQMLTKLAYIMIDIETKLGIQSEITITP